MFKKQGPQNQRSCTIKDHRQKQVLQLCCYQYCEEPSRWACEICMKKNIHVHGEKQQIYLNDQQEFEIYLQDKARMIENSQRNPHLDTKQLITKLQEIQMDINQLLQFLQNFEAERLNNNFQLINSMKSKIELNFYQISSEEVNQIVQISSKCVLDEQWQQQLQKLDNKIQQFAFIFKEQYKSILKSYQKVFQSSQIIPKNALKTGFDIREIKNYQKGNQNNPVVAESDFQQQLSNQFQANQQYYMQINPQEQTPQVEKKEKNPFYTYD